MKHHQQRQKEQFNPSIFLLPLMMFTVNFHFPGDVSLQFLGYSNVQL